MCTLARVGMHLTKHDVYNELKYADIDREYFNLPLFFLMKAFLRYIFSSQGLSEHEKWTSLICQKYICMCFSLRRSVRCVYKWWNQCNASLKNPVWKIKVVAIFQYWIQITCHGVHFGGCFTITVAKALTISKCHVAKEIQALCFCMNHNPDKSSFHHYNPPILNFKCHSMFVDIFIAYR